MRTGQIALVIAGFGLAAGLGASLGSGFLSTPALAASPRPAPAGLIATCDQFIVLQSMLGSPSYVKARDERAAKLAASTSDLEAQLSALRDQASKITDKTSPEFKDLQQKAQQTSQAIRAKKAENDKAMEQGNRLEVEEGYRLVMDATTAVSKREGYTYVIGSRSFSSTFFAQTLSGVFQEIYARPVMVAPEGVDITDMVLKELKIDRLPPPGSEPAKPDAPAAPVAPSDPTRPAPK